MSVAGEGEAEAWAESLTGGIAAAPTPVPLRYVRPNAANARSRPHGLRALQRHADPGEQFLNRKWLGQVIVGAGIEPGNLVHHGIARGDHNHRHILVLADASQHLHAVELR